RMKKTYIFLGLLVTLVSLAGGVWWLASIGRMPFTAPALQELPTQAHLPVPPLSETYRNERFHLSFNYPATYTVREVGSGLETSILVENTSDNKGIQIFITPYKDTDTTITVERIESEVPDIEVTDPQPILLGTAGEGLAFRSNNEDFGGDSREAWFIIAGNLYQISTYAEYDEVLKAIFATWSFF
ncbi:hypothetical protein K2Q08_01785, partial [Patescibacteria group bacterium]|nr:hypothetical protein [Patescibacteria group bacterium]